MPAQGTQKLPKEVVGRAWKGFITITLCAQHSLFAGVEEGGGGVVEGIKRYGIIVEIVACYLHGSIVAVGKYTHHIGVKVVVAHPHGVGIVAKQDNAGLHKVDGIVENLGVSPLYKNAYIVGIC